MKLTEAAVKRPVATVMIFFGVVVNNAIILVDHVNFYARQGTPLRQAIAQGAFECIRPIFLTSATAVFGALPMVLFRWGEQTDIWSARPPPPSWYRSSSRFFTTCCDACTFTCSYVKEKAFSGDLKFQ